MAITKDLGQDLEDPQDVQDDVKSNDDVISEEFQTQCKQLLASANPAELEYLQNEVMKPSGTSTQNGEVTMDDYKSMMD